MILKMWVKVRENGWVKVREKLPAQVVGRSWKITLSAHGERNSASDLSLKARLLALHCIIAHGQNGNNVTAPPRR